MTIRDPYDYYFSLWRYGLDGKGGVYENLTAFFPRLSSRIYGEVSPEAFSAFLDFVLNSPTRYPSVSRVSWLPFGFDLYSTRILSMIVPVNSRVSFLRALGSDFVSSEALLKAATPYCPECLIRTDSLNSDFHALAVSGRLSFMNLPQNWSEIFTLELPPVNFSSIQSLSLDSFLSSGWRSQIECKSIVATWLLRRARDQFNQEV